MAAAVDSLLQDPALAQALARAGLKEVQRYSWERVRDQWIAVYADCLSGRLPLERAA
jgi:glycosyltransferase involved in cell wall biosynthesis